MTTSTQKLNSSYHWITLAFSFLLFGFYMALNNAVAALFVEPITATTSISVSEYSLRSSIIALGATIFLPFYSYLLGKNINLKKITVVCIIGFGLSFILDAFATSAIHFYLTATMRAVFYPALIIAPSTLVNSWFLDKRGMAVGIMCAGVGVLGSLITPCVSMGIAATSWQTMFIILGVVFIAIMLPYMLFLVKITPGERGLQPYRDKANVSTITVDEALPVSTLYYPYEKAIKSKTFWYIIVAYTLMNVINFGSFINSVLYLGVIGYDTTVTTTIFTLIYVVKIFSNVILGTIFDKFNLAKATTLASLVSILAIGALLFAGVSPVIAFSYALFGSIFNGVTGISPELVIGKVFGSKDFQRLFPISSMAATFGAAIGIPFVAFMYESTGSFSTAWYIFLALSPVVTILIHMAHKSASNLELQDATLETQKA